MILASAALLTFVREPSTSGSSAEQKPIYLAWQVLHLLVAQYGVELAISRIVGKQNFDFNARYVHEFDNRKRVEGDLFALSATVKF